MATTILSPLRRARRTNRDLRRALALVFDPSPIASSSTSTSPSTSSSSSSSFSTSSPPPNNHNDDDLLSSLIDHERTGVPAGAGVASDTSRRFDLRRMHRLLARLGNPHAAIPAAVHVVGSKGKGSTAAMVAACAGAAGLRVATLSSPHVRSRRERIAFGGGMLPISRVEFDALVEANADALRAAAREEEERDGAGGGGQSQNRLSSFEALVALGLRAAADRGCELAVIEAGLGGATDATNVFGGESGGDNLASVAPPPSAVVLSSMSLEHAAALGGSLESVVKAKCGVLRRGAPAILARQLDENARRLALAEIEGAGAVLIDAAAAAAPLESEIDGVSVASCELVPSRGKLSPPRTKVKLRVSGALARPFLFSSSSGGGGENKDDALFIEAELRLFGEHQADNAAAAAAAALSLSLPPCPSLLSSFVAAAGSGGNSDDLLRRRWALVGRITPDAISRGLSGAMLPGRFQVARLPLANGGVRWKRGGGGGGGGGDESSSLSHLTSTPGSLSSPSSPSSSSSSSSSSSLSSIPVVLDGAHTPGSAAALARALSAAWLAGGPGKRRQPRLGIVLACAGDKDLRGIAAALRSPPSSLADSSSSHLPPPLRPSVVVFTEVPVAGGTARSAPPGELAAAWQAAVGAEPFAGPSGRCRALVKASLSAAVDAAARELTSGGGIESGFDDGEDCAVLVVTGSLHAVGEALRVLPLEEVVGV